MKCSVRNKGSGGRPASLCPQTLCLGLLETHSFVEHLTIQTFIERTSLVAQLVKNPWVGKIPWRRERLPNPVFWPGEFYGLYSPWGHEESDFHLQVALVVNSLPSSIGDVRDAGLIPGLGRSTGGGHGNTLPYYCHKIDWLLL